MERTRKMLAAFWDESLEVLISAARAVDAVLIAQLHRRPEGGAVLPPPVVKPEGGAVLPPVGKPEQKSGG